MAFLFWIVAGFFGGVIISKNSEPMSSPETISIFLCLIVACGFMWFAGYRGKSVAVATAVATATAMANANAAANAKAAASSAINLYLGAQAGISPEHIASIIDSSVTQQAIENTGTSFDVSDSSSVKESA